MTVCTSSGVKIAGGRKLYFFDFWFYREESQVAVANSAFAANALSVPQQVYGVG